MIVSPNNYLILGLAPCSILFNAYAKIQCFRYTVGMFFIFAGSYLFMIVCSSICLHLDNNAYLCRDNCSRLAMMLLKLIDRMVVPGTTHFKKAALTLFRNYFMVLMYVFHNKFTQFNFFPFNLLWYDLSLFGLSFSASKIEYLYWIHFRELMRLMSCQIEYLYWIYVR